MPIRCSPPTPKAPVRAFWHNVDGVWHVAVPRKKLKRQPRCQPRVLEMIAIVYRRDGGTDTVTMHAPHDTLVFEGVTYDVHAVTSSQTRSGAKRMTGADRGRTRSSGPSRQTQKRDNGDNWFAQFCRAADETCDHDMDVFEGMEPEVGDR